MQELELSDCISLSKNGWTNNKLCIEWIEECFESAIRSHLFGQYYLLIVDGHASHLSTEFIKFTQANKIICFYIPSYLIYLLQTLDIGIFI